jgi:hypothetical protein
MEVISDELLASFLDGNATPEQTMQVIDAIKRNKQLQEVMKVSHIVDKTMDENVYEILPMAAMAATDESNRCAVLSELFVLNKHGIKKSEGDWEKQARERGMLKPEGTALFNIGRMIETMGFSVSRTFHNGIDRLASSLANGQDVIVVVDEKELVGDLDQEVIRDEFQGKTPNHAIVIISIDANEVTFYNPISGMQQIITVARFEEAWNDSCNYMVTIKKRDYKNYVPHPIDLSDIELDDTLIELREAIAENAHEVWAENRQREGWSYGLLRDDKLKQTPDMVPYSDLTEGEKKYDREMAIKTIKLLKKLGYEIVKK